MSTRMSAWPKRVVAATAAGLLCGGAFGAGVGHAAPGSDATIQATAGAGTFRAGGANVCPAGTRATGGGIGLMNGLAPGTVPTFLAESYPQDGGPFADMADGDVAAGWWAVLRVIQQQPLQYKTFAICSQSSDATIEVTSFTVNAGATRYETAKCPTGTRVVGGGAGTATTYYGGVGTSGPLDETGTVIETETGDVARSWGALVRNFEERDPALFAVFALCSRSSDAVVQAKSFEVDHVSSDSRLATCPAGKRALGGGIDAIGPVATPGRPFPNQVIESGPLDETSQTATTDDGDVARSWRASIFNQSGGLRVFKVLALCASDPADSPPSPPIEAPPPSQSPEGTFDVVAPSFSKGLAMVRRRFRVSAGPASVSAQRRGRAPAGSAFTFSLSEPAAVTIVIAKRTIGRRLGGVCKRATRANRRRARCARHVTVGTLRRQAVPDPNRVGFTGRIGRRKLSPGRYRATAKATDAAGNNSQPSSTAFTIVAHDRQGSP